MFVCNVCIFSTGRRPGLKIGVVAANETRYGKWERKHRQGNRFSSTIN